MDIRLLDSELLEKIDNTNNKTLYARIIALNWNEEPIEEIEGRVTSGSISLDGQSSVRRSCSLSMIAEDVNITDFYWGLKTKFSLEIGVTNELISEPLWFPQGKFMITEFSTSYSTSGFSINISGQDKMSLLNGTLGGELTAQVDFAQEEVYDVQYVEQTIEKNYYTAHTYYIKNPQGDYVLSDNEYNENVHYFQKEITSTLELLPIKTIIREAVHTYAQEPYHNIIINDLDDVGLELLESRADSPIYFLFESKDNCRNVTLNGNMNCICADSGEITTLGDLSKEYIYNLVDGFDDHVKPVRFDQLSGEYYVAVVEEGQTAGYRLTDLTYTGELIGNVGENIVSAVLEPIVNMLGDYEYFYNIDGQFVFQKKGTYLNTSWDSLIDTGDDVYAENAALAKKVIYNFEGNKLIQSISNNPQLTNIKNDYSVFGVREGLNDAEIIIHARIAIDDKPERYCSFDNILYQTSTADPVSSSMQPIAKTAIWQEIIFQMAIDYYEHSHEDDFLYLLERNNTFTSETGETICTCRHGVTGYEQYYIDMEGFWRQLYDPDPEITYESSGGYYEEVEQPVEDSNVTGAFERVIQWKEYSEDKTKLSCNFFLPKSMQLEGQDDENFTDNPDLVYWNKNLVYAPELMNFWIDFLDTTGELAKYSVKALGVRAKAINDSDINSIYYRDTPDVIFFNGLEEYNQYTAENITGYTYVIMPNKVENMFKISAQGKSAKDEIDTQMYSCTYGQDSISLTTIPIYYLEPNQLIQVRDEQSGINGEYLVNRMSISLTYNGMMSIDASKAPSRLY